MIRKLVRSARSTDWSVHYVLDTSTENENHDTLRFTKWSRNRWIPYITEMHVVFSIRKYFVTNLVHYVSGIQHIFPRYSNVKNSSMILRNMTSIRLFRSHMTIISICNFRSLNLNDLGQEKDEYLRSIWFMTRMYTFKTSWHIQNKNLFVNRISTNNYDMRVKIKKYRSDREKYDE